jgi:hypothetical protein
MGGCCQGGAHAGIWQQKLEEVAHFQRKLNGDLLDVFLQDAIAIGMA